MGFRSGGAEEEKYIKSMKNNRILSLHHHLIASLTFQSNSKIAATKLSYALAFLLPVAALANPIPEPEAEVAQSDDVKNFTKFNKIALRDKAAEDVGIAARATVTCAIVNVVTTVGCRWYPWHTGWNGMASSEEKEDFGPGTKHVFECYQVGECIGGNCTWDWIPQYGCYVPGYYTDSKCTKAALGLCPFV